MAERIDGEGLRDSQGRLIDYLRLSVTDRCNLCCIYCMPEGGVEWKPQGELLSFEELLRCCRIMAELGIRKVKISGGEPLVRREIASLVASLKKTPGIEQVTMTTNGILLEGELDRLVKAGLDAVNISLDTLDGETFRRLSRREGLDKVLRAVEGACAAGLRVKLNCVLLRGINDHEAAALAALAALAKDRPLAVRFIELMPLGGGAAFEPLPGKEAAAALEERYGKLVPLVGKPLSLTGKLGNGPAEYFTLEGFAGAIGFISPLSRGFCESCNRLRITSLGLLKPCLAGDPALDLRALLRDNAGDGTIRGAILDLVRRKPAHHHFSEVYGKRPAKGPPQEMFRIGG
ncbi:MAG: GTP 3',8-cyclase MoaA [Treponema sp.]|jgi:cyclic pyranopterin phosphate synthase|nr:GTP 3',8-cyclase MoaA [Treponema sp.]